MAHSHLRAQIGRRFSFLDDQQNHLYYHQNMNAQASQHYNAEMKPSFVSAICDTTNNNETCNDPIDM